MDWMDGYVIRRLYSLVVYVVQALWIVASSGWMAGMDGCWHIRSGSARGERETKGEQEEKRECEVLALKFPCNKVCFSSSRLFCSPLVVAFNVMFISSV